MPFIIVSKWNTQKIPQNDVFYNTYKHICKYKPNTSMFIYFLISYLVTGIQISQVQLTHKCQSMNLVSMPSNLSKIMIWPVQKIKIPNKTSPSFVSYLWPISGVLWIFTLFCQSQFFVKSNLSIQSSFIPTAIIPSVSSNLNWLGYLYSLFLFSSPAITINFMLYFLKVIIYPCEFYI